MRVMIVVTHLLGTGHLARAAILGRAFADQGHQVTLVSGGMPVPRIEMTGLSLVQLPPLRSDGVDFARLLDETGHVASDSYHHIRQTKLRQTLQSIQPDALITELFPFGRRNLQTEFLDLLQCTKAMAEKPAVFCSIRDILAPPSTQKKAALTHARIADHYDGVLVHSDPEIIPLELSWPVTTQLRERLFYTGFVAPAPAPPHPQQLGMNELLVSAGGGDVGTPIFDAALDAARLDPSRTWRVLVGGQAAPEVCAALARNAPANLIAEPARPDFRSLLRHASASVSMCGYNTALDVLQAGTPAVWVPFDAGDEVEQGLRANALSHLSAMAMIKTRDLSGERLLNAVSQVTSAPRRSLKAHGFDGAAQAVSIVTDHIRARA